jgi:hypothetical protein
MTYLTRFKVKAKVNLRVCKVPMRNRLSIFQTRPEKKLAVKSLTHLKIHQRAGKTKKMKDQVIVRKNFLVAREDIKAQMIKRKSLTRKNNMNQLTKRTINQSIRLKNKKLNQLQQKSSNRAKMTYHQFHTRDAGNKQAKSPMMRNLTWSSSSTMMNHKKLCKARALNTIVVVSHVEEVAEQLNKRLTILILKMKVDLEVGNQLNLFRSRKLRKIRYINLNQTSIKFKTPTKTILNSSQLVNNPQT